MTRWEIVITAEAEVIPGDPPPDPENSSEDEDQS